MERNLWPMTSRIFTLLIILFSTTLCSLADSDGDPGWTEEVSETRGYAICSQLDCGFVQGPRAGSSRASV